MELKAASAVQQTVMSSSSVSSMTSGKDLAAGGLAAQAPCQKWKLIQHASPHSALSVLQPGLHSGMAIPWGIRR